MKTMKTLLLASMFALPVLAQSAPETPVRDQVQAKDQLQTREQVKARTKTQAKDGECDGTHKRDQLRDGSGGQARQLMKGERQGGGRMMGRK